LCSRRGEGEKTMSDNKKKVVEKTLKKRGGGDREKTAREKKKKGGKGLRCVDGYKEGSRWQGLRKNTIGAYQKTDRKKKISKDF